MNIQAKKLRQREASYENNLRQFIDAAKNAIEIFPKVRWDDCIWEITDAAAVRRAHNTRTDRLFFTEHAGSRVPIENRAAFAEPFADIAKACITIRQVNRGMVAGPQTVFLRMLRYVYAACPLPVRHDPSKLAREHFVAAETAVRLREKPSSAYRVGQRLEEFAALLERHRITRMPIDFRCSIPRLRSIEDRTDADFRSRADKLPKVEVFDALAQISNSPAIQQDDFDLLCMRATELLLVGGWRAGELLTMPANAIVREVALSDLPGDEPGVRLGLRYWPEKGGDPVVKWIPTIAIPLVERAIMDINRICKAARELAKWLEDHPRTVKLDAADDALLRFGVVKKMLNLNSPTWQWIRQHGLEQKVVRVSERRLCVRSADLKAAIAKLRFDRPVVARDDGKIQRLSESLFVTFLNQGHNRRATNSFVAAPLTLQQLEMFLGANGRSVFDKYLDRDNGVRLRIRTHDFRRMLNTMAQRGGLSQAEIARWMGRAQVGDNAAYDYRSAKELAIEYRPLIEKNEVYGIIAEQVRRLPDADRGPFLEACVQMMHHTPSGECASNVAETPCTLGLSCLSGCRYYMRRKNDAKSRKSLLDLKVRTTEALRRAETARSEGRYHADSWVAAQHTILRTISEALAIDDDATLTDGEVVTISPDGKDLGERIA